MLIALDIGNTSINIGFFTGAGLLVRKIDTNPLLSPSEYLSLIDSFMKENNVDKMPEGIIISSVVPWLTGVLKKALKKLIAVEPVIVDSNIETGLKLNIPKPEELGADRIANAAAAYQLYKCPVAAVDFGTATTISVVGKDADYIGGAIMPGISLMNRVLAAGTSKLPEAPIAPPGSALGTDTFKCIQSGLFYGSAGAVERLLEEMEEETGLSLRTVVTGGHSGSVSRFLKRKHDLAPDLTLRGLQIIYSKKTNA